jgi:Tetratricopeptide repeat
MLSPRLIAAAALFLSLALGARGQEKKPASIKLPMSGLSPAKIVPNLCLLSYRISTDSKECQAHFDQGLGWFYSYAWMEAARSFETAAQYDPDCAMAWWGLSRALERWQKGDGNRALEKAKEKLASASHREQFLITARMQEKGLVAGLADAQRKKAAARTIDELLTLYDDDEEAWFARAQLADSGLMAVPYYKALLRINPLHPGANHELVHFYEGSRRPALGWPYAEAYMKSSPGIPHPFHMQAHLATRLGRWDKTSEHSTRAVDLERAYHKDMGMKASEDYQFPHHLEILMLSLIHDGRYKQAGELKKEVTGYGYKQWLPWFKLHLAERDYDEALKVADHFRKSDKVLASYLAALVYLKQGNAERAAPEVEVLQHAYQTGKSNKQLEFRLYEVEGLLMCQTGGADGGLKLLAKAVEKSKDDYSHHAWGNGAYYMESWGAAALACHKDEIAEEAFLEALAHDPGSARAALGLQVLCERQGRTEEAGRYAELAQKCWRRADPQALETELAALRGKLATETQATPRESREK